MESSSTDVLARLRDSLRPQIGALQLTDDEKAAIETVSAVIKRQYMALSERWNSYLMAEDIPIEIKLAGADTIDALGDTMIESAAMLDFLTQTESIYRAFSDALDVVIADMQDQDETEGQDAADQQTRAPQTPTRTENGLRAGDMIRKRSSRRESSPV